MIINLTQHLATPEQENMGVINLPEDKRATLLSLLTFTTIPTKEEVKERANKIALLVDGTGCGTAMIGGAPYLMPILAETLKKWNIIPVFSFTERNVVETTQPDGTVVKTAIFKHVGWVEA